MITVLSDEAYTPAHSIIIGVLHGGHIGLGFILVYEKATEKQLDLWQMTLDGSAFVDSMMESTKNLWTT